MADGTRRSKRWAWALALVGAVMVAMGGYQVYSARAVVGWLWGKRGIMLDSVTVIADGRMTVITDPATLRNVESAFRDAYGDHGPDVWYVRDATLRIHARGLLPVDLRISCMSDGSLVVYDSPLGGMDDVWHSVPVSSLLRGANNPITTAIVP